MTTDNKTLADVQPGGMVRPGDQAERARFDEFLSRNPLMALSAGTAWQVWQAALSAQPSPGGQGDARIPFETWAKDGGFDVSKCKGIYNSLETRAAWEAWLYWQRLAARQPVGEPVAAIGTIEEDEGGFVVHLYPSESLPVGAKVYAAPPAQAVDLGQMPHGIRLVEIPRRNGLDPINVFVQDYELGRGRIVVTCYGQAWCGFWGAMGDRTVMQFVAKCDADYVAGNMLSGRHEHVKKHERTYVERIATEVIAEFRALTDSQAVGNG